MNKKIKKTIANYFDGQITDDETKELISWIKKGNEDVFNQYVTFNFSVEQLKIAKENNQVSSWESIVEEINKNEAKKVIPLFKRSFFKYAIAASIVLLISLTFVFKKDTTVIVAPLVVKTNTITPGTDQAILTLEDGSVVVLKKGNTYQTVNANSNGEQIVYNSKVKKSTEIKYNHLTIPRGGQFFIKLSDGTQVWLNSESQLKYPTSFIEGETRKVELVYGEAYFDVSPSTEHNGSKFKVFNKSQDIEVLGTEFNIKAYKDDSNIYTTLVEGKVSVSSGTSNQVLKPEQQTNLNIYDKTMKVATVNVRNEISWKDGVFRFNRKPLGEIMKTLSRWYDMDIHFANPDLEKAGFNGVLRKNLNIEDILKNIQRSGAINNYEINNKTIILK